MGEKTYSLELYECDLGDGVWFRGSLWELKINASGVAKTDGEDTIWLFPPLDTGNLVDDVKLHTGCKVNGTFPVYHGTWDGHTLYVASHFHGRCDAGIFWGDPNFWIGVDDPEGYLDDGVSWDDGTAHVTFAIELFVDD